jgi:hypothetical protein
MARPTNRHGKATRTLNQGKECPPRATPAAPKPWQATAHLFRPPPVLIVAYVTLCAHRLPSPGRLLLRHTLFRKTPLPGSDGVALGPPQTSTLSGAASPCALLHGRSCPLALLWCLLPSVSFLTGSFTASLWTGIPFPCMVCDHGRTTRSPSPCLRQELLGVILCLSAVGAAFSTICSVARLLRLIAPTLLIAGRTCGTSCRLQHRLARVCAWHFMWIPLMQIPFAH